MKKYHLFVGATYYPSVGLGDYHGSFTTSDEAVEKGKLLVDPGPRGYATFDWYYVAYTKEDGSLDTYYDPDYEEPDVD